MRVSGFRVTNQLMFKVFVKHFVSKVTVQRKSIRLLFIYALNWPFSNIQEIINKMQNSQFFDILPLELLANLSEKDFVQNFSFSWILQVVKVRCFQFYLIKCPLFKCQTLKPCKIKVSWNFRTKTLFWAFPIILSRNLSKIMHFLGCWKISDL